MTKYCVGAGGLYKELKNIDPTLVPITFDIYSNSFYNANKEVILIDYNVDTIVIGIGNRTDRKEVLFNMLEKIPFHYHRKIFPNFNVPDNAKNIGYGNIFCKEVMLTTDDIKIGNFNLFNIRTLLCHDVEIGNHNVFCPNTVLLGGVAVKHGNFLGTGVIVNPSIEIDEDCTISSGTVVKLDMQRKKKI